MSDDVIRQVDKALDVLRKVETMMLAEAEMMLGRNATGQERKILLGVNKDPNIINMVHPTRGLIGVRTDTPDASDVINRNLAEGAHQVGISFQPQTGEELGLSSGEIEDFRAQEIQAENVWAQTDTIRNQINTDQTLSTGLVGTVTSFMASAVDQYRQVLEITGADIDPGLLDANGNFNPEAIGLDFSLLGGELAERARSNAAFKFNISRLAFMLAKIEDPNDRLSFAEVNLQLQLLGQAGGRLTIGAVLDEIDRNTAIRLNNTIQVLGRTQQINVGPTAQAKIDQVLNPGPDTQTTEPEAAAKAAFDLASSSDNPNTDPAVIEAFNALTPEQQREFSRRWLQRQQGQQ